MTYLISEEKLLDLLEAAEYLKQIYDLDIPCLDECIDESEAKLKAKEAAKNFLNLRDNL